MSIQPGKRRGGLKGELALAIPPTVVVLAVLFLLENVTRQRLLFASLAASAFLIYYDPMSRMNTASVMVAAQLIGFLIGIGAAAVFGAGYLAAAICMPVTIIILILMDIVHPPAVSTALAFAFSGSMDRVIFLFVAAVVLIVVLVLLQRTALVTLRWIERYVSRIEHEYVEKIEDVYEEGMRRWRRPGGGSESNPAATSPFDSGAAPDDGERRG